MAEAAVEKIEQVRIEPLPGGFGAEVLGLCKVPSSDDPLQQKLVGGLYEHMVLIFRDQDLAPKMQAEFTRIFGELDPPRNNAEGHPEEPMVLILTNAGRQDINYKTQTLFWHTEGSFYTQPALATMLHARVLPSTGGDTLFANMRGAYESLPEEMKSKIRGLRARHSFEHRMMEITARRVSTDFARELAKKLPAVVHPLVRVHQVTGRKSLFLSELCIDRILGLPKDESDHLLDELYKHALAPEFIYRHKWRPGDIVVWDNGPTMHCAADIPSSEPRIFHRTQTLGPIPLGA